MADIYWCFCGKTAFRSRAHTRAFGISSSLLVFIHQEQKLYREGAVLSSLSVYLVVYSKWHSTHTSSKNIMKFICKKSLVTRFMEIKSGNKAEKAGNNQVKVCDIHMAQHLSVPFTVHKG